MLGVIVKYNRELYLTHCDNLNGKEVQKGGNICICVADSFCCTVEVDSLEKTLMLGGPAILILACASSSPAFLMMYSAYKLNKQGDNIQP